MSADAASVAARLRAVHEQIAAAGGDPDAVTIVAVTKGFGPEAVEAALDAGLADVGENYAQEMVAKVESLGGVADRARWHFVGRLQSNKVRALAGRVALWQSVDRASLVREIARRDPGARVLVQVDISGEEQKGGCAPDRTRELVEQAGGAGLAVEGLMGVARSGGPDAARPGFALLRGLVDDLGLRECSMGMTHDLDAAVAEGATMVRVGTALFGARPPR